MLKQFTDSSDHSELESFYRTIVENAGTAIIVVSEDGTVAMANFLNLPRESIEGRKCFEIMHVRQDLLKIVPSRK